MTRHLLQLFVRNYENTTDPKVRGACGKLAGLVGIICNLLLFGGKLAVGLISGSVAISADSFNNLSDASSSLVTLLGFKLSERPPDEEHPFGHARMEYLSGLAVAVLILLIGVELAKSSVGRILNPAPVEFSLLTLIVLLASVAMKLWMAFFTGNLAKRISSKALRATSADSRNDAIATTAVLLSCIAGRIFSVNVDGYAGLLVALFIIWSGWGALKDTVSPLLGEQADETLVRSIRELILSHEKILGVHDLMVHDYGPGKRFASIHVEMDKDENNVICHELIDDLERNCYEKSGVNLVIHYDPIVTNDEQLEKMKKIVLAILKMKDDRISIHDFRMVQGKENTNLIFDIVLPMELMVYKEKIKESLDKALNDIDNITYYTVITFDEGAFN